MLSRLIAALACISFAGPVLAADLPAAEVPIVSVPSFSWTGAYVGVFAGAAFETNKTRYRDIEGYNTGVDHSFRQKTDSGFTGGLTLGYNYQLDNSPLVVGVEGEIGYLDLGRSKTDPASPGGDTRFKTKYDDIYGTLTAKVGVAFDRFLIFGKAGVAYVDAKSAVRDGCAIGPCGPRTLSASKGADEWNFTAGGGVEYAVTDAVSLKGEYTYINAGQTLRINGVTDLGASFRFGTKLPDIHIVKAGLNYRFNW